MVRTTDTSPGGNILGRIVARTRADLEERRRRVPWEALSAHAEAAAPPLDVLAALRTRHAPGLPAVIAEVKKASPSKGVLRADFDPVAIARAYAAHGAATISVLTDAPFFQGSLDHLRAVRAALPAMPLLRKDFVVDAYQVVEARAAGADAILLIVACLDDAALRALHDLSGSLSMATLVEAYTVDEARRALEIPGLRLLGVNNRDLRTFAVDLDRTRAVFEAIPPGRRNEVLLVSESGLSTAGELRRVGSLGAGAVLVGEHLIRQPDPGEGLRAILGADATA